MLASIIYNHGKFCDDFKSTLKLGAYFRLKDVVPWGRNMEEYRSMFLLSEEDMKKKIAGFGDGPASFNFEAHCLGYDVTSYDPIYQFNKKELE